jgi:hypothetical protein
MEKRQTISNEGHGSGGKGGTRASPRAGERVMTNIRNFIERKLKLRVNEEKSAVAPDPPEPPGETQ